VPLVRGEAKEVCDKLAKGAGVVKKVIVFQKGENRTVDVTSFIRAEARQDEDDWDALGALKRVSLLATDKLRMLAVSKELKEIIEENGDTATAEVQEGLRALLGWPSVSAQQAD